MTRRNKKNKIIQKNIIRNITVVAILIVFLFVIYRFNFSSKSELTETAKINFKEYGENISLNEQIVDLEVLTDFDGTKYILLPEKINGYFVQQYHVNEMNYNDDSSVNTNNTTESNIITNSTTNTLLENIVTKDSNMITTEEVAGLKKYYLTSQNVEETANEDNEIDVEKESDNTNKDAENKENSENADEKKIDNSNTINQNVVENANTVSTNIVVTNGVEENKIEDNNIKNETEKNEVVLDDNDELDKKEELGYEIYTSENNGIKPGTRYNVYETDEEGKYTLGDIEIEVEYQTISNGDIVLYNQELFFEDEDSQITVTGFIPAEYMLSCTKEETEPLENEMVQYEDLKDYQMLCVYDISIQNDEDTYQPENYEFAPSLTVNILSKDLNTIQNELDVKLIHFAEDEIETIQNFETEQNSVEFAANSFSRYAVIAQRTAIGNSIFINTSGSDKYYYTGKNITDSEQATDEEIYNESDLIDVEINYHSELASNRKNNVSFSQTHGNDYLEALKGTATSSGNSATIPITLKLLNEVSNDWEIRIKFKNINSPYKIANDSQNLYEINSEDNTTIIIKPKPEIMFDSANQINLNIYLTTTGTFSKQRLNNIAIEKAQITEKGTYDLEYQIEDDYSGYISATEQTNLLKYKKTLPIVTDNNGEKKVLIELIDNPFMDRPFGKVIEKYGEKPSKTKENILFGFNGWVSKDENCFIQTDEKTFLQTIAVPITEEQNEIKVDLFVDWVPANTVFVGKNGNSTGGEAPTNPIDTWGNALNKLNENPVEIENASNRETNIIVVVDDVDVNSFFTDTNNIAYTVTSLYKGTDYRIPQEDRNGAKINLKNSVDLKNDLQLDFLNITGSKNYKNTDDKLLATYIKGNSYNLRIGRGMKPLDNDEDITTFSKVQGGGGSNEKYRVVIESGKFSNIYEYRAEDENSTQIPKFNATLIVGNDYDNYTGNDDNLMVYNRVISRSIRGNVEPSDLEKPVYDMYIKSGIIGIDAFEENSSDIAMYSGIYVGGNNFGLNIDYEKGERRLTVEGGKISNIIGGAKTSNEDISCKTSIYVRGSRASIQCIVGGGVMLKTTGDRIIQITGGTIQYSVFAGGNGLVSNNSSTTDGSLSGKTIVYVGGNAHIGGDNRLFINKNSSSGNDGGETLYGAEYGCVFGAGNGKSNRDDALNSGNVTTSHVIINDEAIIKNSIYGGGNYGKISNAESDDVRIDILGGTIGNNVYAGSNNNDVDGNTIINMSNGEVTGTIYGGSNHNGNIKGNSTILVKGGKIAGNVSDEEAIVAEGSSKEEEAIFAGGYGLSTNVGGETNIEIFNTNNIEINGNIYGGSAKGCVEKKSTIKIEKNNSEKNMTITGNVFGGGKAATNKADINVIIDGGTYPRLTVFGRS